VGADVIDDALLQKPLENVMGDELASTTRTVEELSVSHRDALAKRPALGTVQLREIP